jgi:hypothetical protein
MATTGINLFLSHCSHTTAFTMQGTSDGFCVVDLKVILASGESCSGSRVVSAPVTYVYSLGVVHYPLGGVVLLARPSLITYIYPSFP